MRKTILAFCLLVLSGQSFAGYHSAAIANVNVSSTGYVYVGLATPPPQTCTNWAWHLKFDGTTPAGKNMLAAVLAAKMTGNSIQVWYVDSTNPGSNQTSGCNNAAMAVLESVAVGGS